ncbi:hypothetical protein K8R61_00715 [bacterium]|nr:hypothetical protein [bacterium]
MSGNEKKIQELKKRIKELGEKLRQGYDLPYRFPDYWANNILREEFYNRFNEMLALQRR